MINSRIKTIFTLSLFLCCLISFTNAEVERIEYDNTGTVEKTYTNVPQKKNFYLDFNGRNPPFFVIVTLTPEKDKETPILCFSNKDQNCLNDRQAIAKKTDGSPVVLYAKKEQFDGNDKKLYVSVTCPESTCSYTLKFEGDQSARMDPNSVYSYLVTNDNREMIFEVYGTAEEGSFLTIGVEGSSTVTFSVDGVEKYPYIFDNGKVLTFPIDSGENISSMAKFTVKGANIGEFLTVSVHVVTDSIAVDNFLYPNGPTVIGMLDKSDGYYIEECFPVTAFTSEKYKSINKYYLTGKIHSKYALFWLADENGMPMEETEQEISDGQLSYFIQTNGKTRSVCFEFSYEDAIKTEQVAYSLSILEPTSLDSVYKFNFPQSLGQFYRKMIPKGTVAVFHSTKIESSAKRFNFNLYNRKGVAEMYVDKCTSYPDCNYEPKELSGYIKPKRTNKNTIWEASIENTGTYETLDSSKYVMIVHCKDDDNEEKGYCEFETSIFTQSQTITLVENEKFAKMVLKGDTGVFKADLKGGIQIQRLTIDIMILSGDVSFNVKDSSNKLSSGKLGEDIDLNYFKYYLSNKVFFHFNFAQLKLYEVEFFTIQYGMHSYNLNQLQEKIPSGESYLVQIDPTTNDKTKTVFLENYRYKMEKPFMANFFALNCEFEVFRGQKEITFFDGYAQEVLLSNSEGYKNDTYEYKITVTEADLSNYNHKMCMLYVSGYESEDTQTSTEILVGENINQQIIFDDNFKSVRFLYPETDVTKDLAIYVNVIDKAVYNVKIIANNHIEKPLRELTVTRSQIFYLAGDEFAIFCELNNLCNIIVQVDYHSAIPSLPKTNPMIEITIRQIKNTPTYLQKGIAKKDFTCGDNYYYLYTDIGKNEAGEVSVNFLRDFGNVWGKVVRKDQTNKEQDANWRVYRMPSEDWGDGLPYNGYIKKFSVGVEQTQDCIEGCYLLLSIRISQIGDYVDDSKFYPFSIITRITPNNHAYTDIPKVVIQIDEFVVGNVDLAENERIYEFYQVWLPRDSLIVQFDWQSEIAGLYINVGDSRPTTKNADFKLLPPGRDSILTLSNAEILEKAKAKKIKIPYENSIQDLSLVIGIWTNKLDSVSTEVYSLRVHQTNEDEDLDILEVNTDQKIICSPQNIGNEQYRCLFMVTFDDEDVWLEMPLLVYAQSLNHSAITNTYASFIEREYYDEFDKDTLRSRIPTSETAKYSTLRDGTDYIYTTLSPEAAGENKYYFYVSVIADREYDIMILTSMPMYNVISPMDHEFYPNPSTEQLLSVQGNQLRLKFFTTSSIICNIITLGGEANVKWSKDNTNIFNLRGSGDRISLTSGETIDEIIINKVQSSDSGYLDNAGFVFYVSYFLRDPKLNFDHVDYGKSLEIGYRQTDLPVFLYSKIGSHYNDINIAFTFKDSDIDTEGEYASSPFNVKAALAKESTIYKAKENPELAPSLEKSMYGSYDVALKTAQVYLSEDFIEGLNIKSSDNPTLYLSVEKNTKVSDKKYTKFNVEAQFSKVNDGVMPVEKTYNYGRCGANYVNFYRLKVEKSRPLMKIEIAFNSNYLDFAVSSAISRTNNSLYIVNTTNARGKILLTVKPPTINQFIVLNIFRRDRFSDHSNILDNYVFKYLNIKNDEEYIDYKILNDDGNLEISESQSDNETIITCTFNKLDIQKGQANVTYFFKVVENETYNLEEAYETIAVMESPFYAVYKRNPEDSNGKITLTAKGNLANWVILQVVAQIQKDTMLEYVTYNGKYNLRPPINNGSGDDAGMKTSTFLIIGGCLLLLIIGLVVVVFIIQQRNKSLLKQVKHVSFQQKEGASADPNLLLQKSQG